MVSEAGWRWPLVGVEGGLPGQEAGFEATHIGLEGEFCVPGLVVVVAASPWSCKLARNAFSCSIPFLARIMSDSSVSSGL